MATQAPVSESSFLEQRSSLHRLIHIWNRRVRLQRMVLWLPRSLLPGLIVGVLLLLVAFSQPFLPVQRIVTIMAALVGAGLVLMLLVVWLWPQPVQTSARRFDQLFELDERVSTALELIDGRIHTNDELLAYQIRDTQAKAQTVQPGDYLPLRWDWRAWVAVVVLLVLTIVMIALMPDYQLEDGAGSVDGPREVSLADEEDLKRLTEDVAADANLTEAEREQLLEEIERATDILQNPDASPEEQMAALSEVESALEESLNDMQADMEAQREALADAADALREMSANLPEDGAADEIEAVQQQDPTPILEQMQAEAAGEMDEASRTDMAEALEQAAEALEQANPEAAESLREAAEALRNGDAQAAQDAMERAQESLGQQQQALSQQQQASDNLSESLGELQQSMAQAMPSEGPGDQRDSGQQSLQQLQQQQGGQQGEQGEQQSGEQAGAAAGSQPGQASQPGSQPGTMPSDMQGQAGSSQNEMGTTEGGSVGAGAGDTSGDSGSSEQSAPAQSGDVSQDNNPDGQGESAFPQLYAPQRIGGEGDTDIVLEPDASGIPAREGEFSDNPAGQALVPYNEVYSDYSDAASRELDRDYIPLALRDVVRDYFSSLEPGSSQP